MTSNNLSKKDRLLPVALVILSLAFLTGLAIYAYLGTFTRYGADDYCFTRTLFKSDNLIQATITWYMKTSNRYTTMLLVGVSEWFGPSAMQYLPALAILLWLASLAWTLSHLSRKLRMPYPLLSGFTLAAAIIFFSILQAPNRYQSLYWRSGMVTYFTPLIAFSLLGGFIMTEIWREKPRPQIARIAVLALVGLGFFFAGGLSETTLAIQGGTLGLSILATWFLARGERRQVALSLLITALIASIIALLVIFFAPANELRVRAFGPSPPLTKVLIKSFIFAWDFMRESAQSFPTPTLASLIIAILFGFGLYVGEMPFSHGKTLALLLIAVPLITYLLIFFSMTPSMYGQGSYPGARSLMATRAVMVTGLISFGLLAGTGMRIWVTRMFAVRNLQSAAVGAAVLFLALSSVYPLYTADGTRDDLLLWYRGHAALWDARDARIREAVAQGVTNLVVEQIDTIGGVQEYKRKAKNWVNSCAADYYGLESLRAP